MTLTFWFECSAPIKTLMLRSPLLSVLPLAWACCCPFPTSGRPQPQPQGPLSSSIPFFYVSGNPFREVLLQHQMVREKGLHGWVYVRTPPQAQGPVATKVRLEVEEQEEVQEGDGEAADLGEGPAETVRTRPIGPDEEILSSEFFEPLVDDDDSLEAPNIEIIELTAKHETGTETVVPLLVLEDVEGALEEEEEREEEEEKEEVKEQHETTADQNSGEEEGLQEELDVQDYDTIDEDEPDLAFADRGSARPATVNSVAAETEGEDEEKVAGDVLLGRPLAPPKDGFKPATAAKADKKRRRKPKKQDPLLKLRPFKRDPLLKVRENFKPDPSFFDFNRPIVRIEQEQEKTGGQEEPKTMIEFVRVGHVEGAEEWVDATGNRRFVGTIKPEGPGFFLNFRILPVGHSFDYDLVEKEEEEGEKVDSSEQGDQEDVEEAPEQEEEEEETPTTLPTEVEEEEEVDSATTTQSSKDDEEEDASTTSPPGAEETTALMADANFDLIKEQQKESEEEEEEASSIEARSLEEEEEEHLEEDEMIPPPRRRQQGKRRQRQRGQRKRGRRPRVIADAATAMSMTPVEASDDSGAVFQPSILEAAEEEERGGGVVVSGKFR